MPLDFLLSFSMEHRQYRTRTVIVTELIAQRQQVLEACEEILRALLDTSTLGDKRKRVVHERYTVIGQIQALVER